MSSSISQAGNFWKKTETSCFSLKQNMWIWSTSRLGWPRHLLILSICNPQLQRGQVDPPWEQIHQAQTCGLTYLMFVYRSFYGNGCCVKVTETASWWWTNMCLYRYVGIDYRNKKVWNWFFPISESNQLMCSYIGNHRLQAVRAVKEVTPLSNEDFVKQQQGKKEQKSPIDTARSLQSAWSLQSAGTLDLSQAHLVYGLTLQICKVLRSPANIRSA